MWRENPHPTDEELLRAADGELSSREVATVREHLPACANCRARLEQIERNAGDFARAYRQEQNATPLADGSRARLRAALEQEKESAWSRRFAPLGPPAGGAWIYTSFAVLLACLAIYLLPHFGRRFVTQIPSAGSDRTLLVPMSNLTPGVARPIAASQACLAGPLDQMSSIPLPVQQEVFHEYGMDNAQRGQYEVDHLITPELGGTDDVQNLWPESYSSEWNARVKDQLEDHLRDLVCEGKLDVSTAQRDIATNWISAYKRYSKRIGPAPVPAADETSSR